MLLAYNTNGLANIDLPSAVELLRDIGYEGISITLDDGMLNPFNEQIDSELDRAADVLEKHRFRCAIETGARFLLDSNNKHEPTLISANPAGRARRIDFLERAIQIAARLNADCVSLWSGGIRDGATREEAFARLLESLPVVLSIAQRRGVVLAFEPEPDMLIDSLASFDQLVGRLSADGVDVSGLSLTIDVGHLHCLGELPIAEKIRHWSSRLANVHIEDMRSGVHEHLMFGAGEIDFPPVIAALSEIGYDGLVSVELSRHSHDGPQAARRAYNYLRPLIRAAVGA